MSLMEVYFLKILVMSDSHGNKENMLNAVDLESPGMILHLGDNDRDCNDIELAYPDIPLRSVRGNCDRISAELDMDEFMIENKRIFMTHGHLFSVKAGKARIIDAAVNRGIDILLFGHTHLPHYSIINNLVVVNPGSIGLGSKSYAVLDITDSEVLCELKRL